MGTGACCCWHTGAGKTTVVRQLLGSDPKTDRFPSTSTAKTTIADTEIVVAPGSFRGVVTFVPRDEVVEHLVDCASKAAAQSLQGVSDAELRPVLLDDENQRFRFSYVLGRHREPATATRIFGDLGGGDETDASDDFAAQPGQLAGIDLEATTAIIGRAITTLRELAREHEAEARAKVPVETGDDERSSRRSSTRSSTGSYGRMSDSMPSSTLWSTRSNCASMRSRRAP